jgi:hypothetical protein
VFNTGTIGYLVYWFCFQLPSKNISFGIIISWQSSMAYVRAPILILAPLLKKLGHKRAEEILSENKKLLNDAFDHCLLAEGCYSKAIPSESPSYILHQDSALNPIGNQSEGSSQCTITSNQDFINLCLTNGCSSLLPDVWETQLHRVEFDFNKIRHNSPP